MRYLRQITTVTAGGTTMYNLSVAAESLGFVTRGVALLYDDLIGLDAPCITTIDGHFVLLAAATADEVLLGDPTSGWRKVGRRIFCQGWEGAVLFCEPTASFGSFPDEKSQFLPLFMRLICPFRDRLLIILTMTLAGSVCGLFVPVFAQMLIDHAYDHASHTNITSTHLLFIGGGALGCSCIFQLLRALAINRMSCTFQVHLGGSLFEYLLSLPVRYFYSRQPGDAVNRYNELQDLSNFLGTNGAEGVVDIGITFVSLCLIFHYSQGLGLVILASGGAILTAALCAGGSVRRYLLQALQHHLRALSTFIESIRNITLIKGYGMERYRVESWGQDAGFASSLVIQARDRSATVSVGLQVVLQSIPFAVVVIGSQPHSALSVGALVAATALASICMSSFVKLSTHYLEMQNVLLGAYRILAVFDEKPESEAQIPDTQPSLLNGRSGVAGNDIEFQHVSFSYGDTSVLDSIDLAVPTQSFVAIVGSSGSGKSTLSLLMNRLLEADAGEILFQGRNIQSIPLEELRKSIVLVAQEPFLIRGTVLENIALGDPHPDLEWAMRTAHQAQAHDFIVSDPMGYRRIINEGGVGLSTGQKQRICIARALYRRPKVLVLDEPTSALDGENEGRLIEELQHLRRDTTLVVIAQRMSTILSADFVFVLESGQIIERGIPKILARQVGRFSTLLNASIGSQR